MGRATQLRDELGCPLLVHIKPTPSEAGWYEVRSGHWELLLWTGGEGRQFRAKAGHLAYWKSLEGLEGVVPVTDDLPVRFRLPTVWEHLLCQTGDVPV